MATRQSVEELLQRCNEVIHDAQEQCKIGSLQEHYNKDEFTESQLKLEEVTNDLIVMAHSANPQQREQLNRMRIQLEQLQAAMTIEMH
ncbi:YtzC family protein [Niallia sp. 01092]|uniref:YtzC family protein n=1 Tax=unclassified Niallia TaxID=2837522 RepID=UPI003FD5D3D0